MSTYSQLHSFIILLCLVNNKYSTIKIVLIGNIEFCVQIKKMSRSEIEPFIPKLDWIPKGPRRED